MADAEPLVASVGDVSGRASAGPVGARGIYANRAQTPTYTLGNERDAL